MSRRSQILTLNAGSSSIKFALFDADGAMDRPAHVGLAEGLAMGQAPRLTIRDAAGAVLRDEALPAGASAHAGALEAVLRWLAAQPDAAVAAVGHRVVHGGTAFDAPVIIDAAAMDAMAALEPLAPLHQPHNLAGVRGIAKAFPDLPQVACFDTAFHRTQPELNQRFALPQVWHDKGLRRYGFHGLSYESIRDQFAATQPRLAAGRVVVAHLGQGASMCGMSGGRSVATTMSFSPLDGLPSGTRCGRLDPAVVLHLIEREGLSPAQVGALLSRESGWLGLSGLSSDMRTLMASASPGAQRALDYLVEQILRELGQLAAALRGLDALVFTGGVGENAAELRARVLDGARWLGLQLDAQANARAPGRITADGSAVAAFVLRTNEEAVIARHTARATLGRRTAA